MQPEGNHLTLADFTGPGVDTGGGQYQQFISPERPDHDPFADYPVRHMVEPSTDTAMLAMPFAITASLAHNLVVRRAKIWACWGTSVVVGWIADAAHNLRCSDHNKDAQGVVHAIDPMVTGARAQAIVTQSLADPDDLQYVIHNRVIWSASVAWESRKYTGDDPHTDHVHISGKHGGANRNAATCTGYNLSAQAANPTFNICPAPEGDLDDMTEAQMQLLANMIGDAVVTKLVTKDLGKPGGNDTIGIVLQTGVLQNSNKIIASLDDLGAKLDKIVELSTPAGL